MTHPCRLFATVATLLSSLLITSTGFAQGDPIRIVVLPYFVEGGNDIREMGDDPRTHYRRIQRFLNNQLVRHNFEVMNPFAVEYTEEEYNDNMERAREDSALAARTLTRKYGVDVVYLVSLRVTKDSTAEGLCKIKARIEGEGYDSAARDLGVGWEEAMTVTKRDCEDAWIEAERYAADEVGRVLTAWSQSPSAASYSGGGSGGQEVVVVGDGSSADDCAPSGDGGAIQRTGERLGQFISVRLDGATTQEQIEIFGKVINTARGVYNAKVYRVDLSPNNPQASQTLWRVSINCTDTFRLASNTNEMLREIVDAGGRVVRNGVVYDYSAAEVDLIKGIRMNNVSSREIQFVLDRRAAQRKEMQGN